MLKRFKTKHLRDSWNLQDGFANVGSGSRRFPNSLSENHCQGVNLAWEMNLKLANFTVRLLQIWSIFADLLACLQWYYTQHLWFSKKI